MLPQFVKDFINFFYFLLVQPTWAECITVRYTVQCTLFVQFSQSDLPPLIPPCLESVMPRFEPGTGGSSGRNTDRTTKVWGLWRPCSPATFYALNIILRDIGIRTRDTSSLTGCASIELLLCRQSHAPHHHQRRVQQGEVQLWPHLDCTVPLPCTAAPDTVLVQGAYIVVQYTTYTGLLSRNTKYTSGTACVSVLHTHYFILRKGSLCVFLT